MSIRRGSYSSDETYERSIALSRESLRKQRAALPSIHNEMLNAFEDSKININLSFVPVGQFKLKDTQGILNQIIVVYNNGIFELLPRGIVGYRVKEFLGVNFNRISYWAMLPLKGTDRNPIPYKFRGNLAQLGKDIYERRHTI